MEFVDLKTQYIKYKNEIDHAIHTVLEAGNFILGHQVDSLEKALANYVGVKHCIAVANGTESLQIALMALGIGPGDEVITVPFTWISSASAVALVGAIPVFVDIEPETYNIDISKIEKAITKRTKAIIAVSLFGQMPDYAEINRISEQYGLAVIEDGAQSFGATQKKRKSCGVTLIGSTSFYPAKPLGCYGEGGALFTDDDQLAHKMRAIHVHGSERRHHHTCLGLNGRLDTLQAAVLQVKFKHYPQELQMREHLGNRYSNLLQDFCCTPEVQPGNTHVYAQYTIRIRERDAVAAQLQNKGIPTGIYYPKCLHEQPVFAYLGYSRGSFPIAERAAQEVLSLPMHPWLSHEEQNYIVNSIKEIVRNYAEPEIFSLNRNR